MKLTTKRALDHYLGSFALLCLSPLVRLLGKTLKRNHGTQPQNSIIILKFQGIGSLAIAKPAIAKLRARHPQARILFWGTPSTCVLAHEMNEFDEILTLNDRNLVSAFLSLIANLLRIYQMRPDWVIDLEVYSRLSAILCTLTCGRNRAGFAVDTARLRRNNHTHLVFFNRHHFLGQAYARLLGLLDMESEGCTQEIEHRWATADATKLPEAIPLDVGYIVVNPNAGVLSLERRWPFAFFDTLIQELLVRYSDMNIVLIGAGKSEAHYCRKLARHPHIIDYVDRLSLREAIQCVAGARLVISNDTAPLHLALLSKAPTVGLFGPTHPATYVDETRPNTRIHYSGIYCSPCVHYWEPPPCEGWNQCMREIRVEDVLRSCIELLGDTPPAKLELHSHPTREEDQRYYPGLVYAKG